MGHCQCKHDNKCAHLLLILCWGLAGPGPAVTRESTGEWQGLQGLHQATSKLHQLHLGQNSWGQEKSFLWIICNPHLHMDQCATQEDPHLVGMSQSAGDIALPSPETSVLCEEKSMGSHRWKKIQPRIWIISMWWVFFLYMGRDSVLLILSPSLLYHKSQSLFLSPLLEWG
jgi:hypothetical protein